MKYQLDTSCEAVKKTRLGKINGSGGLSKSDKKKIKAIRKQRNSGGQGRVWVSL